MKSSFLALLVLTLVCSFSHGFAERNESLFATGQKNDKATDPNLREKIKRIVIPKVNLFKVPLPEAFKALMLHARQNDFAEPDPARKGVNIITLLRDEPAPVVTIQLNKMSLEKMLDFMTEMVDWRYEVREDAIVVLKKGRGEVGVPRGLKVEFFELAQGTINRMTGGVGINPNGPPDPFGAPVAKGPDLQGQGIERFLANEGIVFDRNKGHQFVFDGFQLILKHEQVALDRIRNVLHELDEDVSRQVGVEFKIVVAPKGMMTKVLTDLAGQGLATKGQITNALAAEALKALLKSEEVELKSAPRIITMDGQAARISVGEEMIYPVDYRIQNGPAKSNKPTPETPLPQFGAVAPNDEQPGFRHLGIKIDLTPRVEFKYKTIHLELAPSITEFLGYEEFGHGVKVPKFWSWKITTSVNIKKDHSMILRGPAKDEKQEIIIFLQADAFR